MPCWPGDASSARPTVQGAVNTDMAGLPTTEMAGPAGRDAAVGHRAAGTAARGGQRDPWPRNSTPAGDTVVGALGSRAQAACCRGRAARPTRWLAAAGDGERHRARGHNTHTVRRWAAVPGVAHGASTGRARRRASTVIASIAAARPAKPGRSRSRRSVDHLPRGRWGSEQFARMDGVMHPLNTPKRRAPQHHGSR